LKRQENAAVVLSGGNPRMAPADAITRISPGV